MDGMRVMRNLGEGTEERSKLLLCSLSEAAVPPTALVFHSCHINSDMQHEVHTNTPHHKKLLRIPHEDFENFAYKSEWHFDLYMWALCVLYVQFHKEGDVLEFCG